MTSGPGSWRSPAARVFAVLGHELRNPLAASAASLTAAAELTDAGDPRAPFLRQALADLDRLAVLLDRYLEFGCGGTVRRGDVDLAALARELGQRQRGRVSVEAGGGPAVVLGDAALLMRALENLVGNAFEAGARTVALSVRGARRGVVVDVTDDGPGLPAELEGRLFAPLVSGRGGSGIGLALVAEVVGAHGGEIAALPAARGACFRIRLPAAAHGARAGAAMASTEGP